MKKVFFATLFVASLSFGESVVIDVSEHKPIYEIEQKTRTVEDCGKQDNYNIAGTVIGGVTGGILGHQIGGGSGKKVATVAGTLLGGYAGNKVQDNMKKKDGCTYKEEVFEDKILTGYKNIGYYKGKQYSKITSEKQSKIRIDVD